MFVSLFERQYLLFGPNFPLFVDRLVQLIVRMLVLLLLVPRASL